MSTSRANEVVFKKSVQLNLVNADPRLQMRAGGTNADVVARYSETPEELAEIQLWHDVAHNTYWVSDGHHTVAAYRKAGKTSIPARVHPDGSFEKAEDAALNANRDHGQPRDGETRKIVVLRALSLSRHEKKSAREIAALCGVSHTYVNDIKSGLVKSALDAEEKKGGKGGKGGKSGGKGNCGQVETVSTPTAPGATENADSDDFDPAAGDEEQGAGGDSAADDAAAAQPAPAPLLDQVGHKLGDNAAIRDAFAESAKFRSLKKRIEDLKREFESLAEGPAGRWAAVNLNDFNAHVQSAARVVRHCTPYSVCGACGGRKCDACKNTGWMPEDVFELLPPELKGLPAKKGGKAA